MTKTVYIEKKLTPETLGEIDPTPDEVDLNGIFDEDGQVTYMGKAKRQSSGKYVCLAKNSLGALCTVEVTLTKIVKNIYDHLKDDVI